MSEPMPEQQPQQGGGFMSSRIAGIPAPVFVVGAVVIGYLLFFRGTSGAGSTSGGGGTSSTGNTTISPGTVNVTVSGQASSPGGRQRHGTHNPQPKPHVKPRVKTHSHTVQHKAAPKLVTVGSWSQNPKAWNTTLWGISRHTHTSIAELLKLNPQIRNPNLIYAGQKVRVS